VKNVKDTAEEHPVITLARNGTTYLNDKPVNINNLGNEVRRRFPGQNDVYVRADKNLIWDHIAPVMDAINEAGFKQKVVMKPYEQSK
jgi:biopolymer transport protein ExbD